MNRFANDEAYARHPKLRYIAEQLGTRHWCVAARLTPRLKALGYECAVSSKMLAAIDRDWAHDNPDEARDLYRGDGLHVLHLSESELMAVRAALILRGRSRPEVCGALRAIAKILPDAPPPQAGLAG